MCLMGGLYYPSTFNSISSGSWANLSWDSTYSLRREQARLQDQIFREKEEKLLKLYEEQQNRALKSVGSRSGGSWMPCDLSIGPGKVRYLFQSRRKAGEIKNGNPIVGRDKSFPLQPLTKHLGRSQTFTERTSDLPSDKQNFHQRSYSLDRYDSNGGKKNRFASLLNETEYFYRGPIEETTTTSGSRGEGKNNSVWFEGSRLQENQVRNFGGGESRFEGRETRNGEPDEYWLDRRRLHVTQADAQFNHQPLVYRPILEKMEGKFRNFAARSVIGRTSQPSGMTRVGRIEPLVKQGSKEAESSGSTAGSASSPVRKIRKATPAPLSVAPPPTFQRRANKTFGAEARREALSSVLPSSSSAKNRPVLPPSKPSVPTGKSPLRPPSAKSSSPAPTVDASSLPSNLVNCRFCTRHFAADRISKHEVICQKSKKNNRKPFDALQQRVKGTEAEKYVKKSSSKMARGQVEEQKKPRNDWRKKHEEFIRNIRAAKEVSIHLKNGGKLSELPPPPPSDYSDYVQCPHCSRKFNEAAAERHIPKCANIINNKPKSRPQKSGQGKQGQIPSPPIRARK